LAKITNNPGIPQRFLPSSHDQQHHPSCPARKTNHTSHIALRKIQNTPPIDQGREITGKKNNAPKDTTTTHKAIVASLL
jgi:hypothetical protein